MNSKFYKSTKKSVFFYRMNSLINAYPNFNFFAVIVKPVSIQAETGVHIHTKRLLWSLGHAGQALL